MDTSRAFALLAGALLAGTSYAFEATEFVDPPSTLSRAEVKAQLEAVVPVAVVANNEATVFVDAAGRSRTVRDVRAEAQVAARHYGMAECPYVGG